MKRVRITFISPDKDEEETVSPAVVRDLTDFHTVVSTPTHNVPDWMAEGGEVVAATSDNDIEAAFTVHDMSIIDLRDQHVKSLPNWNCPVTTFHPL